MKSLVILLSFLLTSGYAQIFPVQVTPQLVPPYSPYLSDLTAPGTQNFMVQIRTNDITITNYLCRLRITIEGVGITLRTKENFIPQPLTLDGGGAPQIIYGEEISEYFHSDALDFSGISRTEYQKSSKLPEGVYYFSVEVLDYNRGTVVSNKGMAMAWIILNDPPLLNLPHNNAKVKILDPTNIIFSWTPRHTGSPNAAFNTEYVFRLVEIWPESRNPNDALLSQQALYETTTDQNQILYSISEPALIPGRKYAWQAKARDTEGKDLFKNKGQSEVFVFQFGEPLPVPQNLKLRWAKPTTLAIRWDAITHDQEEVKYRLQYRPRKRNENHQWYETRTKFTDKTLYNLPQNTEFEVKVRAELALQESEYTETLIFKTLRQEQESFACREDVVPPPLPANTLPVFPLSVNDTIHAGRYDVLVRDVMEFEGKFYGSGLAIVPWFNAAKVRVTFEKIGVNDQFWLTTGKIKSVWNADSEFLLNVETPIVPGNTPQAGELDITIVATDSLITITGAAIATITKDEDGNIVIITTDQVERTLPKGESYSITDEVGNGYIVDKEGNIVKTTATQATASAHRGNRNYNITFRWDKGEGKFGFDENKYDALSKYYQRLQDGSYVPWKALSSSGPDAINGRFESGDIDVRKLRFELGSMTVIPISAVPGYFNFSLQGKSEGMEEELLAVYNPADTISEQVLGKINTASYNALTYRLIIVLVNGATLPAGLNIEAISKNLNKVYGQAVVSWEVSLENQILVSLDQTFDEGKIGLFSNYTADMKKVLNAYGRLLDRNYYLFLINKPKDPSTLGYMPRNKQAGFIFVEPHRGNAELFLKTIAHELGHGTFNLRHPFSEHPLPPGATDNLMDYSNGNALYKYQWDHIHEPQSVLGLFEGDEESTSVIVNNLAQLNDFANKDGSYTFMAPTGVPFTLPSNTQKVKFWTNDVFTDGVIQADDSPDGTLIGFTIDNEEYNYYKIIGGIQGSGYKLRKGVIPYTDMLSKTQKEIRQVIIGLPCLQSGELKFLAQKIAFESNMPSENYTAEGTIVTRLPIASPYSNNYSSSNILLDAQLDFEYTSEALAFINENEACLNEMVRYVIKGADVIQRNPGYYSLYKACKTDHLKYPEVGTTDLEHHIALAIYYEKLKAFPAELLKYVNEQTNANTNILTIKDPGVLSDLLKNTCDPNFKLFNIDERKHIIKILSEGDLNDSWLGIGNNRENMVIYAFKQAPDDQHKELLDLLQDNHYKLLKTLIGKCDNQLIGQDNFDKLIDAITVLIQKVYVYNRFEEDVNKDVVLKWGSSGIFQTFQYECPEWVSNNNDEITFKYSSTNLHFPANSELSGIHVIPYGTDYPSVSIAPFDFVPLKLYSDVSLENGTPILKRSVDEVQAIPALYLYWMLRRKATDETLAAISASVNVSLFAFGAGEIMAARSSLRLAFAILDQTFFATSFVLAAGPRKMLEEGTNGAEWKSVFQTFDAFNLAYGAFRIGQGITLMSQDILEKHALLNQLKETENWNNLTPAEQNLIKDEIAKVERGMDELGKVLNGENESNLNGALKGIGVSNVTESFKTLYNNLIKAGYAPLYISGDLHFTNIDKVIVARISENVLQIKIPHGIGWAKQSLTKLANETLVSVKSSRRVYRLGALNKSEAGEAQYWSPENPFNYSNIWTYAKKYGIPQENLLSDNVFFEVGVITDEIPYITREAPAFGNNAGGAIEVVVPWKGVKLESFNIVKFEK